MPGCVVIGMALVLSCISASASAARRHRVSNGEFAVQLATLAVNCPGVPVRACGYPRTRIRLVSVDGRGARLVPCAGSLAHTSGCNDQQPAWSPDGSQLVFLRGTDLIVARADGTRQRRVPLDAGLSAGEPTWSPDGRELAFIAIRPNGSGGLATVPLANPRAVRLLSRDVSANDPSWSPSNRIAFTVFDGRHNVIKDVAASGGRARVLYAANGFRAGQPAWSPSGTSLAFARAPDTRVALADSLHAIVMRLADRRIVDLGVGRSPTWAPDGRYVAFVSGSVRDGVSQIHVATPAGRAVAHLGYSIPTRFTSVLLEPAWRPLTR